LEAESGEVFALNRASIKIVRIRIKLVVAIRQEIAAKSDASRVCGVHGIAIVGTEMSYHMHWIGLARICGEIRCHRQKETIVRPVLTENLW
jgi:hypothetical protein